MEPTPLAGNSRKLALPDQLIAFQLIDSIIAGLHSCGDKVGRQPDPLLRQASGRGTLVTESNAARLSSGSISRHTRIG